MDGKYTAASTRGTGSSSGSYTSVTGPSCLSPCILSALRQSAFCITGKLTDSLLTVKSFHRWKSRVRRAKDTDEHVKDSPAIKLKSRIDESFTRLFNDFFQLTQTLNSRATITSLIQISLNYHTTLVKLSYRLVQFSLNSHTALVQPSLNSHTTREQLLTLAQLSPNSNSNLIQLSYNYRTTAYSILIQLSLNSHTARVQLSMNANNPASTYVHFSMNTNNLAFLLFPHGVKLLHYPPPHPPKNPTTNKQVD